MKKITYFIFTIVSILNSACTNESPENPSYFSFHLLSEPESLDPALYRGSSGNYLFNNLFRGLYKFSQQKLQTELGEKCHWESSIRLKCRLRQKKWSNGDPILAKQYVMAYHRLFSVNLKSVQTEFLLDIKNAKEVLSGQLPAQKLGVSAPDDRTLVFQLRKPNADFIYNLTRPSLGPVNSGNKYEVLQANKLITNGPYKINSWKKGHSIILQPNPFYDENFKARPWVKIYFVENDQTALSLFQTGKLSLLRRLVSSNINKFKNHPGFFQTPFLRFDYIGLTHDLKKYPQLRKALSLSLNYPELKKIYQSKGMPGCPGFSINFMLRNHCHEFSPLKAQKILKSLPLKAQKLPLTLYFSRLGGKDIKKGMEWVQNQWKKHLGLNIKLMSVEQGMYLQSLAQHKTNLFRKGVGIDIPSCLAALNTFQDGGHENFLNFKNKAYKKVLNQLSRPGLKTLEKKRLCSHGIKILLNSHMWIPLGEIHFSMLHDQKYKGWSINSLNQLDLANLTRIQEL